MHCTLTYQSVSIATVPAIGPGGRESAATGSHAIVPCNRMAFIGLFYPWGLILQAVAIVHFVRRRPDGFWLWIILMGGGLGALVYIAAEMLPDANLLRGTFDGISRKRRVRDL